MKIFKIPIEVPKLPSEPKPDWNKFRKEIEKFTLPKTLHEFPLVKRFIISPFKEDCFSLIRSNNYL